MKMETTNTSIKCPSCGTVINVNDILKHQLEDAIRQEYQQKDLQQAFEFAEKEKALNEAKAAFEAKKKAENELFADRLAKESRDIEKKLTVKFRQQAEDEQKDRIELLNKELHEKTEKVRELNKKEAEIARLEREKLEMQERIEAETQKLMNAQLADEKIKIKQQADEESQFVIATLKKQLEDQKKLTEEMKRKQEQGSMQLQGEVLELAIEDYLESEYPLDTIDEIKKGANGADCLQYVNTREHQRCGAIYYESKRAKAFQPTWIEKFKADIREKKADVGVLVTEVLPADMQRMGMKEGIWICTYQEFKGLSAVLRQSIIQLHQAVQSQENKGDKMSMLYDFLTSNEFRLQVEGIVEGFSQMQVDLQKEKNAMNRIWSQREKQIEKVIQNTIGMYGSIRGIAGNAVQSVKSLDLICEDAVALEE